MFIYAANWKMRMPFDQAMEFCKENYKDLVFLAKQDGKNLILFPEFTHIKALCDMFEGTNVIIGAQDCSQNSLGAFTGEVSAISLCQVGCQYCLVGHSERRAHCNETSAVIAEKILRLSSQGIIPILCVGESKRDFLSKTSECVVKDQLESVLETLKNDLNGRLFIAYEPIFSIGTGIVPENSHIEKIFDLIVNVGKKFGLNDKIGLMYGGSIDESNAKNIKEIKNLQGFLMGGISLDFKNFKKIVEL